MQLTAPLAQLIESFQRLPGIGPKTAQRLAFHVLGQPKGEVFQFSEALINAIEQVHACPECFNWSAQSPCEICSQTNRNRGVICVVSDPRELYALERTGEYNGLYHVLQGLISPMAGKGPEDLTITPLLERITHTRLAQPRIEEVILALPPSVEGDTTSLYLSRMLQPLGVQVSRIGFGLPVGGDLEYADQLTISRALKARQTVS